MPARPSPIAGTPACMRTIKERVFHTVTDKYPNAIIAATGCLPVLIPAIGSKVDMCGVLDALDGLLLTGSPSNVHPSEYGDEPLDAEILHDPERDATPLPRSRGAGRRDKPVLAICRGIQELNVALGGTLHQRIQELPGGKVHRLGRTGPLTMDERYGPCHPVNVMPDGLFAALSGGATEIMVNSLHGQGIDQPAPGLKIEATAPDGLVEAVSLPSARFVVGVQWHPEYKPLANPISRALFARFGDACREAAKGETATKRRAA